MDGPEINIAVKNLTGAFYYERISIEAPVSAQQPLYV
jgi:hypothetical protein